MKTDRNFPFSAENIKLTGTFFVDLMYTQKHAHILHKHQDVIELLYIHSGEGKYWVGNRTYAVKEGDIVICNANKLHGEMDFFGNTIETYCIALTGVHIPEMPDNCMIEEMHRPVITLGRFKELIHVMLPQIYELYQNKERELARQMAISVLMMTYQELQVQEKETNQEQVRKTEVIVGEITAYLDAHYTSAVRIEDICEQFHISPSYLSHMFKRETGFSPKQYIVVRRVGEAQSLLTESNMPINEIEEKLGFGSSCHLTSTFKKYVGISPREYRKHFRDGEA